MVISVGLPLLIVNGKFHSLDIMTVEDFETFIPFLVKCSIEKAGARLLNGVPEWWSSIIKYQLPLKKPARLSKVGFQKHLAAIVYRCYWYHKAEFLLTICSQITNNPGSFSLRNNNDNTTSIYFEHNNNHIIKFSNENKDYDAKKKSMEKPSKKRLLLSPVKKTVTIPDIYLCDNCDAEFFSHAEMQKHETECNPIIIEDDIDGSDNDDHDIGKHEDDGDKCEDQCKNNLGRYHEGGNFYGNRKDELDDGASDSSSSEEITVIKHIKPYTKGTPVKDKIFNYLCLEESSKDKLAKLKKFAFSSPAKRLVKTSDTCLLKNRNVEFSSNFGRQMLERCNRNMNCKVGRNILWYEAYCGAKTNSVREARHMICDSRVSYRRGRKAIWNHVYSYGRRQRLKRYRRLKTGLNERSQRLLKQCKKLRIVLTRVKLPS